MIEFLLACIIQVNILLTIVYGGYYLLLKKLTFYQLNRAYFILGLAFSFSYPFLDLRSLFHRHIEPLGEWIAYIPEFYVEQVEQSAYTLENRSEEHTSELQSRENLVCRL